MRWKECVEPSEKLQSIVAGIVFIYFTAGALLASCGIYPLGISEAVSSTRPITALCLVLLSVATLSLIEMKDVVDRVARFAGYIVMAIIMTLLFGSVGHWSEISTVRPSVGSMAALAAGARGVSYGTSAKGRIWWYMCFVMSSILLVAHATYGEPLLHFIDPYAHMGYPTGIGLIVLS